MININHGISNCYNVGKVEDLSYQLVFYVSHRVPYLNKRRDEKEKERRAEELDKKIDNGGSDGRKAADR